MYYRLFDTQTGDYLHTGFNCQTKGDVKRELWSYFELDRKEIFLTNNINKVSLQLLLDVGEFILEESKTPYLEDSFQ